MPIYGRFDDDSDPCPRIINRTSIDIPTGRTFSTAGYYNAFPAAYWAQWTNMRSVTLRMAVAGTVVIAIHASSPALGDDTEVSDTVIHRREVDASAAPEIIQFHVPIDTMTEGGWLWFDVTACGQDATLTDAAWFADVPVLRTLTASLAITTMNKPGWCIRQFGLLADMADMNLIDAVYVVDQGTDLVENHDGYAEAKNRLGDKLRVIRQRNIGGSGGFARGMHEVERHGESGYALLLDDDTVLEPESISRAIAFANHCQQPTLVGGNMLFLSEPTRLCALAEIFDARNIYWSVAEGTPRNDDLADKPFLEKTYLHKRADADYNAWWMCLIPVETIRRIGLSYPFFIKNDDVEYGVRAKRAGYRTVTVPGICLWHQSFVDKDDQLDWQAYYHIRNRTIMGLLYADADHKASAFKEMVRFTLSATTKMRYSAVRLHREAMRDILAGPEHVGDILETRLPEIRGIRTGYPDTAMTPLSELPDMLLAEDESFAGLREAPRKASAARILLHQIAIPRPNRAKVIDGYMEPTKVYALIGGDHAGHGKREIREVPANHLDELTLVADSPTNHWRALGLMDSAVFVDPDRGKGILLIRRPLKAIGGFVRTLALYVRVIANWRKFQSAYRKAFPEMVSPEWWSRYFD